MSELERDGEAVPPLAPNPSPLAPGPKDLGPLTQAELSALALEESQRPAAARDSRIVRLVATIAMLQGMLSREMDETAKYAGAATGAANQLALFQSLLSCEVTRRGGLLHYPKAALDELTGREQLEVRTAKDGGVTLTLKKKIITGAFGPN